jgi:tetrahydromethanopterin S-methyltransferase subunit B
MQIVVDELFALPGYDAVSIGTQLPSYPGRAKISSTTICISAVINTIIIIIIFIILITALIFVGYFPFGMKEK